MQLHPCINYFLLTTDNDPVVVTDKLNKLILYTIQRTGRISSSIGSNASSQNHRRKTKTTTTSCSCITPIQHNGPKDTHHHLHHPGTYLVRCGVHLRVNIYFSTRTTDNSTPPAGATAAATVTTTVLCSNSSRCCLSFNFP